MTGHLADVPRGGDQGLHPAGRRQDPQRHPLAPQRDAGDGPLGRRAGGGREHDADAGDRVGALRDHDLRDRRRPVRDRDAADQVSAGVVDNLAHSIPLGRAGRPEEIAWLVAYLASPAGDFYSGTTITIDGARDNWVGPWPPEAIATRERRACPPRSARPRRLSRLTGAGAARGRRAGSRGPCCAPVVLVAAARPRPRGPRAASRSSGVGDARLDPAALGADLHVGIRVGPQVVEPGRVLREAALGGDNDQVLAVADVEQGRGTHGAALGADVVEQQHRPRPTPGTVCAEAPTRPAGRGTCGRP